MTSVDPAAAFLYNLPRLLWLRAVAQQLQRQSEPTLHVLRPGSPHPPPPSPSRGEGEQGVSPLPATGERGPHANGEGVRAVSPLPRTGRARSPRRWGGGEAALTTIAVLAGSFNPLTCGHVALVTAALGQGADGVLLLLPIRAVDKEGVTRAAPADRALVLLQWAARHQRVGVALVNRGLYVDQAALLAARYPSRAVVFLVGYDKMEQIFDPRYYADREAALEALFGLATFRVAPRQGQGAEALRALLDQEVNRRFAGRVAPLALAADVDALSSTAVRVAARADSPWESLVPVETAALLREARPYSPPIRLPDGEEIDAYGLRLALVDAAAAGRLDAGADFAALYREACSATPQGRSLRTWLAQDDLIGDRQRDKL